MIPIAPTTSDTRPRITKIPLTSSDTASRVARGSGGDEARRAVGSEGRSARGAWEAIRAAAPTSVSITTLVGASRPKRAWAVPAGMMMALINPGSRAGRLHDADHGVGLTADEHRLLAGHVVDAELGRRPLP